jgi:hypothetical protein
VTVKPPIRVKGKPGNRTRSDDGSYTLNELNRRNQEWADQMPTTTACAFCGWTFHGTAAEGRVTAAEHRTLKHPDVRPAKRRRR